ncbi:hypothetical protein Aple_086610 [Acrocarpospora pleiomorpha]|uniref:Luciferase-like domain-containing protein n=1 Tax=Acrocarpospora pleiomorpha TaxID=90975 RepID=A0A5M3XXP5_9ACTN|nr:TIGR03619 family F420-dependent LLM class oxidoreductase [Acrocarpospora pleiomorpha]GES25762.1 hypothetical protein Aple_086610 [Acrocarpospora pleiomorpha]
MRFTAAVDGLAGRDLATFVQELERSGFDAAKVPDSICYPEHSESRYPYTRDGRREFLADREFLDPFVLTAAIAAVTRRLRTVVSVLKLPVRHPLLVAKQAASAAVVSDNRLVLGVGMSPWPDDYAILGIPWDGRGARFDECISILQTYLGGGFAAYHGEHFDLPSLRIKPVPDQPVPLLIGGHSRASLRRAARVGAGWSAAGCSMEELSEMLDFLTAERRRCGRQDLPFDVHVSIQHDATDPHIERLAALGVTHAAVNWSDRYAPDQGVPDLHERLERVAEFGERVVARWT